MERDVALQRDAMQQLRDTFQMISDRIAEVVSNKSSSLDVSQETTGSVTSPPKVNISELLADLESGRVTQVCINIPSVFFHCTDYNVCLNQCRIMIF
jgi:hypothetical protein